MPEHRPKRLRGRVARRHGDLHRRRRLDRLPSRNRKEGLKASSPHLLGSFSYADIVMATLLQGVSPVADRFLALGPATRAAWTREGLAREYADLLEWRDRLYEAKRVGASTHR